MPVFEFVCDQCQREFEELVFSPDDEPVACPSCGNKNTSKILSRFAFKSGTVFRSSSSRGDSCGGCHPTGGCGGCKH